MRAKIMDVSWWQFAEKDANGNTILDYDNIDFEAARADGFDGVILRAGRGKLIDESFQLAADAAKDAGFVVGAYWYLYVDQCLQVQKMVDQVEAVGGVDMPLFLDVERYGNEDDTPAEWQSIINSNTKYLVDEGFEVGFYSSLWMWRLTGDMDVINGLPAKDYIMWTAHWPSSIGDEPDTNPDLRPIVAEPWDGEWEKWQQGSDMRPHWNHQSPDNRTDFGVFKGTSAELFAKYKPGAPEPEPDDSDIIEIRARLSVVEGEVITIQQQLVDASEALA